MKANKAVMTLWWEQLLIPEGDKEPADYFKAPPANAPLGLCKCGGFPSSRLQSFQDGIRAEPNPRGGEGRKRKGERRQRRVEIVRERRERKSVWVPSSASFPACLPILPQEPHLHHHPAGLECFNWAGRPWSPTELPFGLFFLFFFASVTIEAASVGLLVPISFIQSHTGQKVLLEHDEAPTTLWPWLLGSTMEMEDSMSLTPLWYGWSCAWRWVKPLWLVT